MADDDEIAGVYGKDVRQSYTSFMIDQAHVSPVEYAPILDNFPANGTILTYLTPEIISIVLSYLIEHGYDINITLQARKRGRMASFKSWFPGFENRPLFKASNELRDHCVRFLFSNNQFFSQDASSFQDLPRAMGEEWVSHIRRLKLKNHFLYVTQPTKKWDNQLEFIVTKLPELIDFVLTADFPSDRPALSETGGKDRSKQEIRGLIGIGAFKTLRHPILTTMIWPEGSGADHNGRIFMSIELKAKDLRMGTNDHIINSTAIRRCSWNELHDAPIETFFLLNNQGPEPGTLLETDCKLIDKFGYVTRSAQRKLGHTGLFHSTPKLIHNANINKTQQERQEKYDEERTRRDQMSLDGIAALTLGRRGQNKNGGRGAHGFGRGSRGGKRGHRAVYSTPTAPKTVNAREVAPPALQQPARGGLFGTGSLFGGGGNEAVKTGSAAALHGANANDSSSTPGSPVVIARRSQEGPQPSRASPAMNLPPRGRRWADL